jgi:hypothetical protein
MAMLIGVVLMNKLAAKKLTIFLVAVIIITALVYGLNYLFWTYGFPVFYPGFDLTTQQHDMLFLEGIGVFLLGVVFFLGSGGIDEWESVRAAVLGSVADVLYPKEEEDQKAPGPNEVRARALRRDVWQPSGYIRPGLILLCAGVVLILLYLL